MIYHDLPIEGGDSPVRYVRLPEHLLSSQPGRVLCPVQLCPSWFRRNVRYMWREQG
jgi:hypothetical protein